MALGGKTRRDTLSKTGVNLPNISIKPISSNSFDRFFHLDEKDERIAEFIRIHESRRKLVAKL